MAKIIQYKTSGILKSSLLDVDDKSRRVKNVFSRMDVLDTDNDVIEKGAFTKTLSEWGPTATNRIWHLTDHKAALSNAVGKFSELYTEGNQLIGITDIPNTTLGNDILELYKSGHINEHSIGFVPIQKETKNADGISESYTLIKEIQLYEGSSVLFGANPLTPNLSVGKSLLEMSITEKQTLFKNLEEQLLDLSNILSKGKFSEEMISLLQINVKQIQASMHDLITNLTQSEANSIEPIKSNDNEESFYKELLLINSKIKTL